MQSIARELHIFYGLCSVQRGQLHTKPAAMFSLYAFGVA